LETEINRILTEMNSDRTVGTIVTRVEVDKDPQVSNGIAGVVSLFDLACWINKLPICGPLPCEMTIRAGESNKDTDKRSNS
jgi:hypothetical protein